MTTLINNIIKQLAFSLFNDTKYENNYHQKLFT